MNFTQLDLDPNISKALQICGYEKPTPIQARSIPDILKGKDVLASAQTGTGKTAAFVLPALHRLSLSKSINKPRVLILTPTRELAAQITEAATKYGKFMRFNIVSLVGGMPYRQQLRQLSRPVDIIVATPGRLLDHVENRRVDLSAVEMLILDEADRMLDMGFIDDVKHIAKLTPDNRQTLLFSATVDNKLSGIVRQLLKEPVRIDLSEALTSPLKIKQELYRVDNAQHKNRLLKHFLDNGNMFKAIIFSATKINADSLATDLRDQGYAAAALHGDLKQSVRNRTVEQLRRGKIQFLVATDVAARGIDISDVTHVINYDLPKFSEDYVHRIGRTGRAGKSGIAISFASPADARHMTKIERYTGQRFQIETIEGLEPSKKSSAATDKKREFQPRKFKKDSGREYSKDFRKDGKRDSKKEFGSDFRKDAKRAPKKEYSSDFRKDSKRDSSKKEFSTDFRKDSKRDSKREFTSDFRKDSKRESSRKEFSTDYRKDTTRDSKREFSGDFRKDSKRDSSKREFSNDFRKDAKRAPKKEFSTDYRKDSKRDPKKEYSTDFRKDSKRDSKREYSSDFRKDSKRDASPRREFSSDFRKDTKRDSKREFTNESRKDSTRAPKKEYSKDFRKEDSKRGGPKKEFKSGDKPFRARKSDGKSFSGKSVGSKPFKNKKRD